MLQVAAKYFSERCLEMLDNLNDEGLVITRDGVPYAKALRLVQGNSGQPAAPHLYGALERRLKVVGDIDAPAHRWDPGKFDQPWGGETETMARVGELDMASTGLANPNAHQLQRSIPSGRQRFKVSGPRC